MLLLLLQPLLLLLLLLLQPLLLLLRLKGGAHEELTHLVSARRSANPTLPPPSGHQL